MAYPVAIPPMNSQISPVIHGVCASLAVSHANELQALQWGNLPGASRTDVFIGVYWESYGCAAPGATISGIEDELERSQRAGSRRSSRRAPKPAQHGSPDAG